MHDYCQTADTDVPCRRAVGDEKARQIPGFRSRRTWHGCCSSMQERY